MRTKLGRSGMGWRGGWGNERVCDVGQGGVLCGRVRAKGCVEQRSRERLRPWELCQLKVGRAAPGGQQRRGGCHVLMSPELLPTQDLQCELCARDAQLCTG